ncbi:hypothetical protein BX666DRAFT_2010886 [Dichotomocladium elegans]|nr:hypothetical protein BX666DRAFT_2010886 [Dichotomocladium elegans]
MEMKNAGRSTFSFWPSFPFIWYKDMSSDPIRVGIIGTGIFAYRHLRAYRALGEDKFKIVACANRSRDKAEKFAKEAGISDSAIYTNPNDLIHDPNVEVIDALLPVQYNREIVEAAIQAKKHIIFEKPIAHNLEDARKIVQAARKAQTIVTVAENWSHHSLVQAVADYVRQGGIGEMVNFTYDSARPFNPDSLYHTTKWRQVPQHPGGYLSDGGVHDMAHLIPILGAFDEVSAFITERKMGPVSVATLASVIKLANGAVGTANFTFASAGVKAMRLEIHGTNGTIRLTDDTDVEILGADGKALDAAALLKRKTVAGFEDVEGEMYNLYSAIRYGAEIVVKPEDGFAHLAVIVAALKAAETGTAIKVPQIDDA